MIKRKSSRINNGFEICEVSNQSQLLNTLLFLQKSFKWSKRDQLHASTTTNFGLHADHVAEILHLQ